MGSEFSDEFQCCNAVLWNFPQNLSPYNAKYAFYDVLQFWRVVTSKNYDIINLNEIGPVRVVSIFINTRAISPALWYDEYSSQTSLLHFVPFVVNEQKLALKISSFCINHKANCRCSSVWLLSWPLPVEQLRPLKIRICQEFCEF